MKVRRKLNRAGSEPPDKPYHPREFQDCTVRWVLKNLFGQTKNSSNRFLVADEVGLGKTIVARGVIEKLRELKKRKKKNAKVIYISSSIDISRQNRSKLTSLNEEVSDQERITLLYSKNRRKKGMTIYFLTPGTSLANNNSVGTLNERLYMAWLLRKKYSISSRDIVAVFECSAKINFKKEWPRIRSYKFKPPPQKLYRQLVKQWKEILCTDEKQKKADSYRTKVKRMRSAMARLFLDSLNPDLIILDEFQKFKEVTDLEIPLEKRVFLSPFSSKPKTRTLLLSATPYRPPGQDVVPTKGKSTTALSHYQDLLKTMEFLLGDKKEASKLVGKIAAYGDRIVEFYKGQKTEQAVTDILKEKPRIESQLGKYMARTERVFFQNEETQRVDPRFLSNKFDENHISRDLLKEFLMLRKQGEHGTLLSYWKSGSHLMSYLLEYKLGQRLRKDSELRGNPFLYSKPGSHPARHLKLDFLREDVFPTPINYNYLWVPPSLSYYEGGGIYNPDILDKNPVKKGLVFSSWKFVPRNVSAEISAGRDRQFKRYKKKTNPLKITPVTWAKFYHPSPTLSQLLTHDDFLTAESVAELKVRAKDRIKKLCENLNIPITKGRGGSKAWQVLCRLDFSTDPAFEKATFKLLGEKHRNSESRPGKVMSARYLKPMPEAMQKAIVCSNRSLDELVTIALCSPSVVMGRSLNSLFSTDRVDLTSKLQKLCVTQVKNYLNRPTTYQAIAATYKKGSYGDKVQRYFLDGNFQAVMDEFLFLIKEGTDDNAVDNLFKKLDCVFKYHKSVVQIRKNSRSKLGVVNHIAVPFGDGSTERTSRDDIRNSFNSPFWPFVLTTTSIGQEGLDFHLYCRDIYHWNLPSNPVDFEQREGRINRFRSLMVRKGIVNDYKIGGIDKAGRFIWERLFNEADLRCHPTDRYNLGLSPDWIFTPKSKDAESFNRYILDLPYSSDKMRYDRLMEKLEKYRLAFGQPNQDEYLKKFREGEGKKETIDLRAFYIDLFPYQMRDSSLLLDRLVGSAEKTKQFLDDAWIKLKEMEDRKMRKKLAPEVARHCKNIKKALLQGDKIKFNRSQVRSIEAVFKFVFVRDEIDDRISSVGYDDDYEVLRKAG